jgi:hypothetical protein
MIIRLHTLSHDVGTENEMAIQKKTVPLFELSLAFRQHQFGDEGSYLI